MYHVGHSCIKLKMKINICAKGGGEDERGGGSISRLPEAVPLVYGCIEDRMCWSCKIGSVVVPL